MVLELSGHSALSENSAESFCWMYRIHQGMELLIYWGWTVGTRALLRQSRNSKVKKGNGSNNTVDEAWPGSRAGSESSKNCSQMQMVSTWELWGRGNGAADLGVFSPHTSISNILKDEKNASYSSMTAEQDGRRGEEKLIWTQMQKIRESERESLRPVWLFVTSGTVALQAPLSTEFSRQQDWSGMPFHSLPQKVKTPQNIP